MEADGVGDPDASVRHVKSHQPSHGLPPTGVLLLLRKSIVVRMRGRLHNRRPGTSTHKRKPPRPPRQPHKSRHEFYEAKLQAFLTGEVSLRRNRIMQTQVKGLPRLTTALRNFGGLSSDLSREPVIVDEMVIRNKRKRKIASRSDEESWARVSEMVLAQCGRHNEQKVGVH